MGQIKTVDRFVLVSVAKRSSGGLTENGWSRPQAEPCGYRQEVRQGKKTLSLPRMPLHLRAGGRFTAVWRALSLPSRLKGQTARILPRSLRRYARLLRRFCYMMRVVAPGSLGK